MGIIYDNLVEVPVYWNGQLFTEMTAKTLDFLGILKDLHLPQLPDQISSSQASALPSSPTGLYVFYEGKGVMGLRNGSLVPTTAGNFPDTQSILDAARSGGFVFDPELFQKQGGDPSSATITQHIITLDGKTISRLVQTTTLQVTLP